MYESYFGLDGPPFQLNPDPAFYFDSRGHANALAYLRFGVYQAEGFIVVTGDVGAGKTTLVRTLLAAVDPQQIVAAQIVSTQLEAGDLLRSIISAFGICAPLSSSKAHLISTIEAFLTALATTNRRALLVVDEAQNLNPQAVEELRMLSNFMLGSHALLQSFLVGQPDLRRMLASKSMEQFRQRVIASCHLGPLEPDECRGYVEHRLRRAGWTDSPRFESDCLDEVHRWTGGIPRRINLLCNRLLLSTFLAGRKSIAPSNVEDTALELSTEVGELKTEQDVSVSVSVSPARVASKNPVAESELALPPTRRANVDIRGVRNPLLIVVDTPLGMAKAMVLASIVARQADAPLVAVVNPGIVAGVVLDAEVVECLQAPPLEIHLNVQTGSFANVVAQVAPRFSALIDEFKPLAVLALGESDGVMTCVMVAHKQRVPLARLEAGQRAHLADANASCNAALMDRMADILYTGDPLANYALHREGVAAHRVHGAGRLIQSVLAAVVVHALPPDQILHRMGNPAASHTNGRSHVLVTLQISSQQPIHVRHEIVSMLCALRVTVPVVWLATDQTIIALEGHSQRLRHAAVALVVEGGYRDSITLLSTAACVFSGGDDARWLDEAGALGIHTVRLDQSNGNGQACDPNLVTWVPSAGEALQSITELLSRQGGLQSEQRPDGEPAARLVSHLRAWLAQRDKASGRHLSLATAR
jgi:general secretion pathway protein A